jgi:three-Cys-motif partner protein
MDKKGIIQEHSKIKLELYRLYLERYLSILFGTPFFGTITVNDIFAGSGKSKNDEKGSAMIAAETIDGIIKRGNPQNKLVFLNLNEVEPDNCAALEAHLKAYEFVRVSNGSADDFIQKWKVPADSHNLHFIDPHGYTQISIDNLHKLFRSERCEFVIFIPIFHIYRFLKNKNDAEPLEPIANFLKEFGIGENEAKSVESVEEFADLIKVALGKMAGTDLVYAQIIENQTRTSKYGLFFITKDYLGAEKFIEAQTQLKQHIRDAQKQPMFLFVEEYGKPTLKNLTKPNVGYDNVELYKIGIKAGIAPKAMKAELDELERGDAITVTALTGKPRRRGAFYINHENFKNQERRVSVVFGE